jgi:hypothetical protein
MEEILKNGNDLPTPMLIRESIEWEEGGVRTNEESEWVTHPSGVECGFDVDVYDGSYSLDRPSSFKLPRQLVGELMHGSARCIEHSLALTDDRRARCFILFDTDGRMRNIVQCDESMVQRPSGKVTAVSTELSERVSRLQSTMLAAGGGSSQNKPKELDVLINSVRVNLALLAAQPWVGDTTIHKFPTTIPSSSAASSFGTWTSNVLKIDVAFNDEKIPAISKRTHLRGGFGAQMSPLTDSSSKDDSNEDCSDEDAGFITQGFLQDHPSWGLNPRCIEFEGGDRLLLLAGGCMVMVPSRPVPLKPAAGGGSSEAFHTEFSSILQTTERNSDDEDATGNVANAVIVGEEGGGVEKAKTHMARSQRIYVGGRASSASTAFFTAGGMRYY